MAHILIIDDSPTDVRVFTTLLEKHGHRVSSAASAEEGIAAAKRERPDMVIMDVIMPGMNTLEGSGQGLDDMIKVPGHASLTRPIECRHAPVIETHPDSRSFAAAPR